MQLVEHVTTIGDVVILANADAEAYQFLVNGAVCAMQAYDGIRICREDPEYDEVLAEIFAERASYAKRVHANGIGPIYI